MKYIYEYRYYLIFLGLLCGGLILLSNLPREKFKTDLERLKLNWEEKGSYFTREIDIVKSKTLSSLTIKIRFAYDSISVEKKGKDSSGKWIEERYSELFSEETFSAIQKGTGFNYAEMTTLKSNMEKAEINEINSTEPCVLSWSGGGFNGYGYLIFRESMTDSMRKEFSKAPCRYYQSNDSVIIVAFGGPAWGSNPCLTRKNQEE